MKTVFIALLLCMCLPCLRLEGQVHNYAAERLINGGKKYRYAIEHYPDVRSYREEHIQVYKSFFNSFKIVFATVPWSDISLKGDGIKIIKDTADIFYLRVIDTSVCTSVQLYVKDTLVENIEVTISRKTPLPELHFFESMVLDDGDISHSRLKFDSLQVMHYFPNPDTYDRISVYTYHLEKIFSVVSFDVQIERSGLPIYTEHVIGNQYPYQFRRIANKYGWCRKSKCLEDVVVLKNVTIKDDLGNTYVYPEMRKEAYWD